MLKPANLSRRVYDHLKARIRTGDFSTAEPVFEVHLADDLGVSRTPIREALAMLEVEGYVESVNGGGVRAYPVSTFDLLNVTEARIALEQVTARLAALHRTDKTLAAIDEVLAHTAAAIDRGLLGDVKRENERFHRVIATATGTRFLEQMVDRVYDYVDTHRLNDHLGARADVRPVLDGILAQHAAIADAIRARDPDAAARLMEEHLKEVGGRYVMTLEERSRPDQDPSSQQKG